MIILREQQEEIDAYAAASVQERQEMRESANYLRGRGFPMLTVLAVFDRIDAEWQGRE